jgi:hypothetical protein
MRTLKNAVVVAVFTTSVIATHAQTWLTNGLVAYYPLNGNANDVSGNGINGVLYNVTPTTDRFGQPAAALNFNSTNSYIDFGAPASLQFTGDFSVTAWMQFNSAVPGIGGPPRVWSNGGDTGYELLAGEDTTNRYFDVNLANVKFGVKITSSGGAWNFVAVCRAGNNTTIFVDGNFIWTNIVTATPSYTGFDLNFGRKAAPLFDGYFNGAMDNVRFYNRALSSDELAQLYAFESTPFPHTATATAIITNGFLIGVSIINGGYGYTNTPQVRFIGGGGSGAGAYAVVSNGVVTSIIVTNAGFGYTNAPLVVIDPPFIPNPVLNIAPMSFLSFSNLTVGGAYQLQQSSAWYWTNLPVSFTATNALYTQMIAGMVGSGNYRLALNPVPAQALATPQVVNGFVVGASVTSGGSGYVTSPAVNIVGGHGTNATAVSLISGGVVTNITITSAGIGYTGTPTVEIAPPPAAAIFPTVQPVMRVDFSNLAPYDNYQIQFTPALGGAWVNWAGGLFTPTDVTNSQFLFITNGTGFFRLLYEP